MSEDSGSTVITARIGGRQRRLSTAKQWRAAIANQDLARNTEILYELGPGRVATMTAGECPALVPLFDDMLGPLPVAPPPAPPEPEPEPAPAPAPLPPPPPAPAPVADEDEGDSEDDWEADPDRPVLDAEEVPQPAPVVPPSDPAQGWKYLGALVAVLLLLALIVKCSGAKPSDASLSAGDAAAVATPAANLDDPALWQTMYGVNPLNIRTSALSTAKLVATLPRGSEVTGALVPGEADATASWLMIKRGPQTGRFVSTVNLSATAPPPIDASTAGDYYIISEVMPLTAPDASAAANSDPKQILKTGQKVKTNGTISGWAEVGLNRGGVGFVSPDNLSTTKPGAYAYDDSNDGAAEASLVVINRCSAMLKIGIYYHSGGMWRDNNDARWDWGPSKSSHPSVGGTAVSDRITADNSEIYIVVFERNGSYYANGLGGDSRITYGGRTVSATKYYASTNSDGSYQVSIC